MAIAYAGLRVELREVVLKNKPQAMLCISPKGTVPVLHLSCGNVIDESREIMQWAMARTQEGIPPLIESDRMGELVEAIDHQFKPQLDRYKYADRYPESSAESYRDNALSLLTPLAKRLKQNAYLFDSKPSFADIATFPFVRQFAHVDKAWFEQAAPAALQHWLDRWLSDPLFLQCMDKYPQWQPQNAAVYFPEEATFSGTHKP